MIGQYLQILPGDEVKDFEVINFVNILNRQEKYFVLN